MGRTHAHACWLAAAVPDGLLWISLWETLAYLLQMVAKKKRYLA